MTNEQKLIEEFMLKAGQELPIAPTSDIDLETRKLRAKLILEEALETINDGLGLAVFFETGLPEGSFEASVRDVTFQEFDNTDLIELADGVADLLYVSYGTASTCGVDMEPVFDEVHKSNMSKFIDGYKDSSGKWIKGPSFRPPDIKTVIEKQMEKQIEK